MKRKNGKNAGFSLVEVSIALGILAFVILAVFGLMGVGLSASKSAQVDTALAAASRFAVASLQTNAPGTLNGTTFLFDYDGKSVATTNQAFFQCTVATNSPAANAPRLIGLRLQFQYPVSAPANARFTNSLYASTIQTN